MSWDVNIEEQSSAYKFASDQSKTIRVVAGPGTGKSFALRRRVARLLEEGQNPERILAVTFTRTAAQDLKSEIESIGIEGAERVVAKTLHSYCFGLLNRRDIIENTGRCARPMLEFEQKPMLYDLDKRFGALKEKQKRLKAFEAAWARLQSEEPGFSIDEIDRDFEQELTLWLRRHQAMLFGEMIIQTFHYLRNNPQCFEKNEFEHVLVDEYQDLNKAEQAVIDLMADNCNIAIIGDDDQSIYSFKHAHPEGIREFPATHPGCAAIDFDECRRCPKKVVSMASSLISHNPGRTLGALREFEQNQEGEVTIAQWQTLGDEIAGIGNKIASDIAAGVILPEDILILTPVRRIGYKIRDLLVQKGVSAKSYFRESAIESEDLKYSFALLTLMANPDDMVSLRYLLGFGNQNSRTISYKKLLNYALNNNLSVLEVLKSSVAGTVNVPGIASLVKQFVKATGRIEEIENELKVSKGALTDLLAPNIPENSDFRNILDEAIAETETEENDEMTAWLQRIYSHVVERVSFPENTSKQDHVRIMSFHASKGLSAKYVVVMSAIDELIPRPGSQDDPDYAIRIEEQRRLFYVAITRCKSSDSGYPGTLIISSFVGIPGSEALALNISARPTTMRRVSATRFISELGASAPATIIPEW